MATIGAFLNAVIGFSPIPIFIFAHLAIMNSVATSIKTEDEFFEYWRDRLTGKSYDEIWKELLGIYSLQTIKLLSEPELRHKKLKRRILTSPYFEKTLAIILSLLCLRFIGALTLSI